MKPEGRPGWPRGELPSVPRPRRWIRSPALVSEVEAPPSPMPCLPLREHTEAGTLWSLLSTREVPSPPRASCVTRSRPWKPRGPSSSQPACLQGFGRAGERGLCLQAKCQDQNRG